MASRRTTTGSTSTITSVVPSVETLRPIKITVVGDGTVGKTCMLISYTQNSFPEEYIPTVFDNHAKTLEVDGLSCSLTLWDTAGQEEYEKLRPLSYPKTDCFLLCYAVNNKSSFANVESKWVPELRHHCPKAAILLVATKTDLLQDPSTDPRDLVSEAEGKKLKSKIKAQGLIQCSAKTTENLESVFVEAVRAIMKGKKKHGGAAMTMRGRRGKTGSTRKKWCGVF